MIAKHTKRFLAVPALLLCSGFGCSSGSAGNSPLVGTAGASGSSSSGTAGASGSSSNGTAGASVGGSAPGGGPAGASGSSSSGTAGASVGGSAAGGGPAAGSGGVTAAGGGASGSTVSCTFNVTPATLSSNIPTVGIVQWSSDLANLSSAHIDFGLDTNYGMSAPVDLTAANYRTLLLGMKPSKTYHFRVVASNGTSQCQSQDSTVTTGAVMNGLPKITITTTANAALAGGYLVTGTFMGGPAYILDADGDYVWWYNMGEVTRARMSYDGKYMWMCKGNVPQGTAKMVKVAMDGSGAQDLSSQFTNLNHDFTILPDESIAYIAYDNGCDKIVEQSPSGTNRTVVNLGTALGGSMSCHANAIAYSPEDDTYIASELDHSAYIKVTRQGTIVWVLGGGSYNNFTGDGATWVNEHNLHILGANHFLMFNNGPMGQGSGSKAIELQLDTTAKTAMKLWEYLSNPTIANSVMGDVQRLANGNTLVTYSTQGNVQEVASNGTLLQALSWPAGGAIGYSIKRPSLYGAPPANK